MDGSSDRDSHKKHEKSQKEDLSPLLFWWLFVLFVAIPSVLLPQPWFGASPNLIHPAMGRRALRKIDTTLDLSRHLKALEELPRPWDAAALFECEGPLEVEVGSGKGMFLLNAAQQHPERNYLGSEIAENYARFCAARLAKRGMGNACVVRADAGRVFREVLPDGSLAAVHVYFPDPWWKARHKKRRVMTATFLRRVEKTLQPGGRLHFWTDVEEYFETTLAIIGEHTRLQGPYEAPPRLAAHDMDYQTNFERRVRQLDKRVYRAEFSR